MVKHGLDKTASGGSIPSSPNNNYMHYLIF